MRMLVLLMLAVYPLLANLEDEVTSWLTRMTIEQRIGQLVMPGVFFETTDDEEFKNAIALVEKYPVGGILVSPTKSADAAYGIQLLRNAASTQTPFWVAMDAEWGAAMRVKDKLPFPHAMTLGAIHNREKIHACAQEIGRELKELGVDINFAPVVDLNNNRENPVIHDRSFGQDPEWVIECAQAYLEGLTDSDIIGCAKHFPGHGDTSVDSHFALPVIDHTLEHLLENELKPFAAMIHYDVPMIMMAHLLVTKLDDEMPASLSSKIIKELLREKLQYKGLVITDGLKMKAVADEFDSGQLALLAFKAGNDIILQLEDTEAGIKALCKAYDEKEITEQEINERVARILHAKIKHERANTLQEQLYQDAVTLVNNNNHLLPLTSTEDMKNTVLIDINEKEPSYFAQQLRNHIGKTILLPQSVDGGAIDQLLYSIEPYQNVLVSIAGMNKFFQKGYGISAGTRYLCERIQHKNNMVVLFGTPYAANDIAHQGLLVAYEGVQAAQKAAARVVVGEQKPLGKLPVSIGNRYSVGTGVSF